VRMEELQQLEFIQVFEKNFSRKCEMTVDSTSDKSELSLLTFWCQSPLISIHFDCDHNEKT
jgi:hypothetical protein